MSFFSIATSRKHKNSRFWFNLTNIGGYAIPQCFYRCRLNSLLSSIDEATYKELMARVSYYNKLSSPYSVDEVVKKSIEEHGEEFTDFGGNKFVRIKDFTMSKGYSPKAYFFDTYRYIRYFPIDYQFSFLFGDVVDIAKIPQLVKSRPICDTNENSVLLKLNQVRHFMFVNDTNKYENKKDILVGRGGIYQKHRERFYEKYFNHPLCDLGHVGNTSEHKDWQRGRMTIEEQLQYKFILCLEGNDVASNLKWVMSSNSIAVMPKPKFETWFMEGTLKGDFHYIEIKDDYSDLSEKLNYYMEHPEEAKAIIKNAHAFVKQFKDPKKEYLCSLLVLKKYFELQKK